MEKLKPRSRVSGQARIELARKLKERYDGGATIRILADELNRSYGFVHRLLAEESTSMRGRGGSQRVRPAK